MTRVYLVRHGQTDWNADDRVQGRADVPLNARGAADAARLRDRLAGVRFDAVVSSPLARARQTAASVLADRPVPLTVSPALTEIDYGRWQGTTPAERRRDDPRLAERWETHPESVHFPGGESFSAFRRRVLAAWTALCHDHAHHTVLVSAHGHVNRVILLHILGWAPDRFWTLTQSNAGCTEIACGGQRTEVGSLHNCWRTGLTEIR